MKPGSPVSPIGFRVHFEQSTREHMYSIMSACTWRPRQTRESLWAVRTISTVGPSQALSVFRLERIALRGFRLERIEKDIDWFGLYVYT
jgi:hypothetical protein